MSQSTTTAGSQQSENSVLSSQVHSQNETCDPNIQLKYPDRQEWVPSSPEESFMPCSQSVQLTQMSQASLQASQQSNVTTHVSATPSQQSVSATPTPLSVEDKVRKDIEDMNREFKRHKYDAFVHGNLHIMFKRYPFDLTPKWWVVGLI